MPYGMPKEMGGDSPENDKWMENCVMKVMHNGKGMDKEKAIAICKSTFMKSKGDKTKASIDIMLFLETVKSIK